MFVKVADPLPARHVGLIDHTVLDQAVEHRRPAWTVAKETASTAAEVPVMAAAALLSLAFA
ncbi:hypothetical protein ACO0M4_07910 [Streptomyces sp. RGM 3693]|uniref:hypothetical protein n=1 Tax=Streptomyces sp. RGM 3693 TaxID=3413284 RepID=UPI003D29C942